MDELKFKFIYNGEESLFSLIENIRVNNSKVDRFGRLWNGYIKIKKQTKLLNQVYFIHLLMNIIRTLKNEKNVPIEISLHSP